MQPSSRTVSERTTTWRLQAMTPERRQELIQQTWTTKMPRVLSHKFPRVGHLATANLSLAPFQVCSLPIATLGNFLGQDSRDLCCSCPLDQFLAALWSHRLLREGGAGLQRAYRYHLQKLFRGKGQRHISWNISTARPGLKGEPQSTRLLLGAGTPSVHRTARPATFSTNVCIRAKGNSIAWQEFQGRRGALLVEVVPDPHQRALALLRLVDRKHYLARGAHICLPTMLTHQGRRRTEVGSSRRM